MEERKEVLINRARVDTDSDPDLIAVYSGISFDHRL